MSKDKLVVFLKCVSHPFEYFKKRKEEYQKDLAKINCLRRKLETALKLNRMYKEFWDNVCEAFLLVRVDDGQILDANPAACSLYGYTLEDFKKITMYQMTSDPISTRAVADDHIEYVPSRFHINHDGSKFLITATLTYFKDATYEVAACIIRPVHPLPDDVKQERRKQ